MKIYEVKSLAGGVGATTLTIMFGYKKALVGNQVMLIDRSPRGDLMRLANASLVNPNTPYPVPHIRFASGTLYVMWSPHGSDIHIPEGFHTVVVDVGTRRNKKRRRYWIDTPNEIESTRHPRNHTIMVVDNSYLSYHAMVRMGPRRPANIVLRQFGYRVLRAVDYPFYSEFGNALVVNDNHDISRHTDAGNLLESSRMTALLASDGIGSWFSDIGWGQEW